MILPGGTVVLATAIVDVVVVARVPTDVPVEFGSTLVLEVVPEVEAAPGHPPAGAGMMSPE